MAPPTPTSNGKADLAHVGIDDAINYFKQQTKQYPTEHRDAHMAMDDLMQKADKCALELVKFVTAQTVQKTIDFITSTSVSLLHNHTHRYGDGRPGQTMFLNLSGLYRPSTRDAISAFHGEDADTNFS